MADFGVTLNFTSIDTKMCKNQTATSKKLMEYCTELYEVRWNRLSRKKNLLCMQNCIATMLTFAHI